MRRHKFNWYLVFWAIALLAVLFLYYRYHITKDLVGIVETKTHLLGAQEPGTIRNILVSVGEKVSQGQVLATLDISDLEIEKNQLKEELTNIQNLKEAQQDHLALEFQRMGLQLENEASDLADRLSILEAKSTELSGLNAEIDRLKKAEEAGLGHSRDLADLVLRRDALASYLREQSKDLQLQNQKLNKTRRTRQSLAEVDTDSIVKSMLLRPMERAEELRRQIALTEHRMCLRTIIAPCNGHVVEMFAHPGDVVQEFTPILSVEESNPRYLVVYVPEKSNMQPELGTQVKIFSGRSKHYNTIGLVTFVHPGFSMTPERLSFMRQVFWARRVHVALNENHALLPGEIVHARISNKTDDSGYFSMGVQASESSSTKSGSQVNHPPLKDMQVAQTLWQQSRFEPSGIAWLEDIEKYLILSDDTGIKDTNNDHAPWLFLMNDKGEVDSSPVTLNGIHSVNDLEAIAPAENGIFYLVSSQNISKQDKRPIDREMILKVQQDGKTFNVQGRVAFLSLILDSYSEKQRQSLGLEKNAKDGRPVLNIEGAAYYDNVLYLGLKEPIGKNGAIIWKLNDPSSIFNGQKLLPEQLSLYGYVHLGEYNAGIAGISDLIFDYKGRLWALSTIAGADDNDQLGGLHRIVHFADGRLESRLLYRFPRLKPEGFCFQSMEHLVIVFDKDNETPSFCVVTVEDL
jgi:multidrug resistance efflux pump